MGGDMNDINDMKKILIVDDNAGSLSMINKILSASYKTYPVDSAAMALRFLEKNLPDMILLDVEMPVMSGYEAIQKIKGDPKTADIPVIFLTVKNDAGSELEGLSLGAIDYIFKPFSPPLLLKRIEVHLLVERQKKELQNYNDNLEEMVRQKTKTILELQNAVLATMAELVEYRDTVTGGHIERTQKFLKILIDGLLERKLYLEEASVWDIDRVIMSAQLHDVGKIAISDNILRKPTRLTADEFEEMKKHTVFGEQVIEDIQRKTSEQEFLNYAKILSVYHHERWDGKGYPYGLAGKEIPLLARLMAIVDVYDALVSERSYKQPLSHEDAMRIIVSGKGTQFDPALVDLFLTVEDKFTKIR